MQRLLIERLAKSRESELSRPLGAIGRFYIGARGS